MIDSEKNSAVLFLHIPKTAGSTFHMILHKRYPKKSVCNVFGARYSDKEIKEFIVLPDSKKKDIALLKGHQPFGLHNYMPKECTYISILRDPVERVISQYYYIKKNAFNPFHEQVEKGGMSLVDFVESGMSIGINNGQCRFFYGDVDKHSYGQCDDEMYSKVISNLKEHFIWLGLTERFDESVLILSKLLGWETPPYYIRENVSKIRKPARSIDTDTIETIKKYNNLDIKLHNHANKLLDQHISEIVGFDQQLEDFKIKNQKIQKRWGWLPEKLKRIVI